MVHSVPFPAVFSTLSSIFLTCWALTGCPGANVVQKERTVPRNATRSNLIRCNVIFSTAYTRPGPKSDPLGARRINVRSPAGRDVCGDPCVYEEQGCGG